MAKVTTLKNRSDFVRMTNAGARYVTPAFVVQYMPVQESLRFGFTASKKVGNAIKRNRAKRRMRGLVETLLNEGFFQNISGDFVIIARQEIINRDFSELQKDLKKSCDKVSVG